jgi:hypothetical protein
MTIANTSENRVRFVAIVVAILLVMPSHEMEPEEGQFTKMLSTSKFSN